MKRGMAMLLALALTACVGTTGGELVEFDAVASGPGDAVAGEPLRFQTSRGWQVELSTARLYVGALYLVDSFPVSGAQATSCVLQGSYVAEVVQGLQVDLLSSAPQRFPTPGRGSTLSARAGQVWLTGGDVNRADDPARPTVILQLSGTATLKGEVRPFDAALTIANNRISTGSTAGAAPICKERIVSPIGTDVRIERSGALWLRVDPRRLFTNVDFGALQQVGERFAFRDDSSDQPSANLYNNLKQGGDLYVFSWVPPLD